MTRVLLFGSCLLRSPFHTARREAPSDQTWAQIQGSIFFSGIPFFTRSLGEAIQAIEFYQGKKHLWPEIKMLCGIDPDFKPNTMVGINHADALLVEPMTTREIMFQGFYLNNRRLRSYVIPFRERNPLLARLINQWYTHLRYGGDDADAADVSAKIVKLLPRHVPDDGFCESLFRSTVAREMPVRAGLEHLRSLTTKPLGIVGRTDKYDANGCPTKFAADFSQAVAGASRDLDLPYFDPEPVVQAFGFKRALRRDLSHYNVEFHPTIARPLFAFVNQIAGR